MTRIRVGELFLRRVATRRFGVVPPWSVLPYAASDLRGFFNVAVPGHPDDFETSASGGIGRSEDVAINAAIGEAIERYATRMAELRTITAAEAPQNSLPLETWSVFSEDQRNASTFPYASLYDHSALLTPATDAHTGDDIWVPQALVTLAAHSGDLASSSGVACASQKKLAELRGVQELIERDALMVTWLHSRTPVRLTPPDDVVATVEERGGTVWLFDISPTFTSQRVALMAGSVPFRGRMRNTIGCACRSTWEAAAKKAFLEFVQGTVFLRDRIEREHIFDVSHGEVPRNFDEHAMYYTVRPELWHQLPLLQARGASAASACANIGGLTREPESNQEIENELERVVAEFARAQLSLFRVDLSTRDLRQIGLSVVRMMSPDLSSVHHNHAWPHLGNASQHGKARYANECAWGEYPSQFPHALG